MEPGPFSPREKRECQLSLRLSLTLLSLSSFPSGSPHLREEKGVGVALDLDSVACAL